MGFENFEDKKTTETSEKGDRYAEYSLLSALRNGATDRAYEIKAKVSQDFLDSEQLKEAAQEGILMCARLGDLNRVLFINDYLNDSENTFRKTEEARAAAIEGFQSQTRKKNPNWTDLHLFGEIYGIMETEEIRQAVLEKFMTYARTGSAAEALDIKKIFALEDDFLVSPEATKAIREGLMDLLQQGNAEAALESRKEYGLPKDYFKSADFEPAIREGFISLAKGGDIEKIFHFSNKFNVSDDIFFSPEAKMNIRGTIRRMLQSAEGDLDLSDIDVLAQAFDIESDLKEPMFKQDAGKMLTRLQKTDPEKAEELRKLFGLPEDVFPTHRRASTPKGEGTPGPGREDTDTQEEELKKVRREIFEPGNTDYQESREEYAVDGETAREREKRRERIIRNVLQAGGFRVSMVFESIGMAKGQDTNGSQSVNEKLLDPQLLNAFWNVTKNITTEQDKKDGRSDLQRIMTGHQLHELLDIRHAEEAEEQIVRTPGKKGFLGFGKTEDKVKKVLTGRNRRLMHSELVAGGKEEPAVTVTYKATANRWSAIKNSDDDWKTENGGRGGQSLEMVFIVPESLAKEFEREIDADPSLIREVSERIMKEKILAKPEVWDNPSEKSRTYMVDKLKPPFEKWDKEEGGGRIYIQKEGEPQGWNEESVKTIGNK